MSETLILVQSICAGREWLTKKSWLIIPGPKVMGIACLRWFTTGMMWSVIKWGVSIPTLSSTLLMKIIDYLLLVAGSLNIFPISQGTWASNLAAAVLKSVAAIKSNKYKLPPLARWENLCPSWIHLYQVEREGLSLRGLTSVLNISVISFASVVARRL